MDPVLAPELVQHRNLFLELRHGLLAYTDLLHLLDGDVVSAEHPLEDAPKAPLNNVLRAGDVVEV